MFRRFTGGLLLVLVLGSVAEADPRRWYEDPLGDALVGVGAVGVVTGACLLHASAADLDRAKDAPTWDSYDDRYRTARAERGAGSIAVVMGSALVVCGVARWWWVADEPPRVSVAVGEGGGSIVWAGRF